MGKQRSPSTAKRTRQAVAQRQEDGGELRRGQGAALGAGPLGEDRQQPVKEHAACREMAGLGER